MQRGATPHTGAVPDSCGVGVAGVPAPDVRLSRRVTNGHRAGRLPASQALQQLNRH